MIRLGTAALLVCGLALAGCANSPLETDEDFGHSTQSYKARQIANADAGDDTPVTGLSPTSADGVSDAYQERRSPEHQAQRTENGTLERLGD